MPDIPLSESRTPEHLIVGIGAGLTVGIDAGDCGCCVGGFGGFFQGTDCDNGGERGN